MDTSNNCQLFKEFLKFAEQELFPENDQQVPEGGTAEVTLEMEKGQTLANRAIYMNIIRVVEKYIAEKSWNRTIGETESEVSLE